MEKTHCKECGTLYGERCKCPTVPLSAEVPGYAFLSFVDCPWCGNTMDMCNSHGVQRDSFYGHYMACVNADCRGCGKIWQRPKVKLTEA